MTATTARKAAPAPATTTPTPPVPADKLQSVLGAHNAANLASLYIERGNFTAARRKLTQALASLRCIEGAQGGAA